MIKRIICEFKDLKEWQYFTVYPDDDMYISNNKFIKVPEKDLVCLTQGETTKTRFRFNAYRIVKHPHESLSRYVYFNLDHEIIVTEENIPQSISDLLQ